MNFTLILSFHQILLARHGSTNLFGHVGFHKSVVQEKSKIHIIYTLIRALFPRQRPLWHSGRGYRLGVRPLHLGEFPLVFARVTMLDIMVLIMAPTSRISILITNTRLLIPLVQSS